MPRGDKSAYTDKQYAFDIRHLFVPLSSNGLHWAKPACTRYNLRSLPAQCLMFSFHYQIAVPGSLW